MKEYRGRRSDGQRSARGIEKVPESDAIKGRSNTDRRVVKLLRLADSRMNYAYSEEHNGGSNGGKMEPGCKRSDIIVGFINFLVAAFAEACSSQREVSTKT